MLSLTLAASAVALLNPPPAAAEPAFPRSWSGRWRGPSSVFAPGRPPVQFTMELHVGPTDRPDRHTWTIVYDGAAGRQERPYELVVRDAAEGRYAIDEKQSIVIESTLLDGALYSQFVVMGNRISAVYRRGSDADGTPTITVELVTVRDDDAKDTGGEAPAPVVRTLPPRSLQRAVMKRVAE